MNLKLLTILALISSGLSNEDSTAEAYHPFQFGYQLKGKEGHQYRKEVADSNGLVRGSYGFIDENGTYREVFYQADADGFKVTIKSNEPGVGIENPADVKIYSSSSHNDQYTVKSLDSAEEYSEGHKSTIPTHHEKLSFEHQSGHHLKEDPKQHHRPHGSVPPLKSEEYAYYDHPGKHHQSHSKLLNNPPKNYHHKTHQDSDEKLHPGKQREPHLKEDLKQHHRPQEALPLKSVEKPYNDYPNNHHRPQKAPTEESEEEPYNGYLNNHHRPQEAPPVKSEEQPYSDYPNNHHRPQKEAPPVTSVKESYSDYPNNHHQLPSKLTIATPKNHPLQTHQDSYYKLQPSQQPEYLTPIPQKLYQEPPDEYVQEENDYSTESYEPTKNYKDKQNEDDSSYNDKSNRNRYKQLEKEVELTHNERTRNSNQYGQRNQEHDSSESK